MQQIENTLDKISEVTRQLEANGATEAPEVTTACLSGATLKVSYPWERVFSTGSYSNP